MKYKDRLDNHDFMTAEQIAGFLRKHGTGTDNKGRHFLAQVIKLYDNPTVLDAACGPCVNWEVFKAMGATCRYTGMDRTKAMLADAARNYGDEIELVEGYVQDMPFDSGSKDIVLMRHILEHLPDGYQAAVTEGLRIATKELILVLFLMPCKGPDKIKESQPDENNCTYFMNTYNKDKLFGFLANLGCQLESQIIQTPGAAHPDLVIRLTR